MRSASHKIRFASIILGAMLLSFVSGVALAEGSPLDKAKASVSEALTSLKAAKGADPAFATHRDKAVNLLTRAQGEILKAKSHASGTSR
jgi:hypothetical protein